jgi:hypothetical protein
MTFLPRRIALAALLSAPMLASLTLPAAAQTPTRLRGTLEYVGKDRVRMIKNGGGQVELALTAKTGVATVAVASLTDVARGSYIGTAAVPGKGGVLVALEVHIFAEAMRGLGDGHRPFDLEPESTMTNGTVGDVAATDGTTLTVTYKGGEQKIMVPPGVPVVSISPGGWDLVAPGTHVIIFADKAEDGTQTAARILVGAGSIVPPM